MGNLVHMEAHGKPDLDHVLSVVFARKSRMWQQIESSVGAQSVEQPDTRVFVHLSCKPARDILLQVLVRSDLHSFAWTSHPCESHHVPLFICIDRD